MSVEAVLQFGENNWILADFLVQSYDVSIPEWHLTKEKRIQSDTQGPNILSLKRAPACLYIDMSIKRLAHFSTVKALWFF